MKKEEKQRNKSNSKKEKNVVEFFSESLLDPLPLKENVDIVIETKELEIKATKANIKLYFNAGTQDAIVKYQSENLKKVKDKLYVASILPAFEKLVENLIHIHKFTGMHDTYDELKNDCVNFLFETIHKFDDKRGTNAFSYFNVVAKNWLIIKTKQRTQRTKKSVSLDDAASFTTHEAAMIEEHNFVPTQDFIFSQSGAIENTINLLYEIRTKVKTENELTCINSIITIFENIDEIDLLNKSAVLLYMRELSGLSPKQLTTAMQCVKRHYKKSKLDLRND